MHGANMPVTKVAVKIGNARIGFVFSVFNFNGTRVTVPTANYAV